MGWSEAGLVVCGKHPDETPQPGICPSCLRERLSSIVGKYSSTANYNYNYNYVSASSPSISAYDCGYYSASSSLGSSPARRHRRRHQRVASDIMDSIYLAFGGGNGLKKSRSMANYAPRDDGVNHKKKGGFWNRLLLRSNAKKSSKFW